MLVGSFRNLSPKEKALLERLVQPQFPGCDEIREQLTMAAARTVDEDGCLEFLVKSQTKLTRVKHAVPTEAEYEDPDGVVVHVLLHVRGDAVAELEFFREDNTRVQSWPDLATLVVFAPQ